jgi:DNA polymerase-3 subunit gamma/tau
MPMDETQLLYSICLHGIGELGLAPDEYAALTMVLLRLLAFKPTLGSNTSAEKKTLKPARGEPAAAPTAPAVRSPAEVASLSAEDSLVVSAPQPAATIGRDGTSSAGAEVAPNSEENKPVAHIDQGQEATESRVSDSLPVGQRLPVVSMPVHTSDSQSLVQNRPPAQIEQGQIAPEIAAIQVRVQADSVRDKMTQAVPDAIEVSPEGDFWYTTVQALIAAEAINAMARELALQSQLVARDSDEWLLRVERESLNQSGGRDRLTAALTAAGHPVRLAIEVGRVTDSPAKRNAAAAAQAQLTAEKIVFDDPFVQTMMREFAAKIVPGSIKPIQ